MRLAWKNRQAPRGPWACRLGAVRLRRPRRLMPGHDCGGGVDERVRGRPGLSSRGAMTWGGKRRASLAGGGGPGYARARLQRGPRFLGAARCRPALVGPAEQAGSEASGAWLSLIRGGRRLLL